MKRYTIEWESKLISGSDRHKPDDYTQRAYCGGFTPILAKDAEHARAIWAKLFKQDRIKKVREAV